MQTKCSECEDTVDAVILKKGQQWATSAFDGYSNLTAVVWQTNEAEWVTDEEAFLNLGLLHHRCASPSIRDRIDPDRNWFFCERPSNQITRDTLFDRNCHSCASAWVTGGAELWPPVES